MDFLLENNLVACKIYFEVKDGEVVYSNEEKDNFDFITVYFRKPNWYYDSDIIRQSLVTAHDNAYAKEVETSKYYDIELKTVLLYIDFGGGELIRIDSNLVNELDSKLCDIISKKYQNLKKNYKRNKISKQYELKLCRDIYSYLKFHNIDIKSGNVNEYQEPPMMPAILAVVQIAEKFHWTFDYIINLPEDIISCLLTAMQQRDEFWEKYPTLLNDKDKNKEEYKGNKNLILNKEDFLKMKNNFLEKNKEQKRGR